MKANQKIIRQLIQSIQSKGPNSNQIDELTIPVALFKKNGMIIKANRVLIQAAGIAASDLDTGRINLLNRITTENDGVLDAAERVFKGESSIVIDLVDPISMFVRDDFLTDWIDDYQTALFFPVSSNTEEITCGAVVFMKQNIDEQLFR